MDATLAIASYILAHEIRWKLLALLARSDYCVQELVGFLHQSQNLFSYHLRQLRDEHVFAEPLHYAQLPVIMVAKSETQIRSLICGNSQTPCYQT
jgi:hypothetical protein